MKKLPALGTWMLYTTAIFAQTVQPIWTRTEDNNGGGSGSQILPIILPDSFHNIILCADTYHPGPLTGFATSKYDPDGNLLWRREYQTPATDLITAAATDASGAVYVGGNSINIFTGQAQFVVFKYAANGDSLWRYVYVNGTARGYSLARLLVTPEQDLLVVGAFTDIPNNNAGMIVARLDPSGQVLWEAPYDAGDYGYSALDAILVGGRLLVWGRTGSPEGGRFFCWQLGLEGQTLDTARTEPYTDYFANCLHIDEEGHLYVGDYSGEYKVIKYSKEGATEWEYHKNVTPNPNPNGVTARLWCIQTDLTGNVYASGVCYVDTLEYVTHLTTKITSNGEMQWEHSISISGYGPLYPQANKILPSGLLLLTGAISVNLDSNYYQFFVATYNSEGIEKLGVTIINGPRNMSEVIQQDDDHFYVAGISFPQVPLAEPIRHFLCKYALTSLSETPYPTGEGQLLSLWPNPFDRAFFLSLPDENTSVIVRIADLKGAVVYLRRFDNLRHDSGLHVSDLDKLSPGLYQVSVHTPTKVYFGRAIKGLP